MSLIEDLVATNRIRAEHGVIDGYGHVSVRSENDPNRYLLSRSLAPELVNVDDIVEFDLDSNPLDGRGREMYRERFIHGEVYQARPEVMAVVHKHSPSVIPFGVTVLRRSEGDRRFGSLPRCGTSHLYPAPRVDERGPRFHHAGFLRPKHESRLSAGAHREDPQ